MYIPTTMRNVIEQIGRKNNVDITISFEPFGKRKEGQEDPEHPNYRLIDGKAYHYYSGLSVNRPTVFFESDNGRKYILCPGMKFKDENWDMHEEFPSEGTLSDLGMVLGIESEDGSGYIPIGVNVVVLEEK